MTAFAVLAVSSCLSAQGAQVRSHQYHHFQLIDMGTFGGPQSYLFIFIGINDSLNRYGDVAGWADTSAPDPFPNSCFAGDCLVTHGFRWHDGVKTELATLGGGSDEVVSISDIGLIAGDGENGELDPLVSGLPQIHGMLWRNGGVTDLGTWPAGGYETLVSGVNNRGQVVGFATNTVPDLNGMPAYFSSYPFQSRAFVWQNGVMQDLGTLGGTDAQANFINDQGQVVGWSYTSSASGACGITDLGGGFTLTTGSFIWDKQTGITDLGGLGGTCTGAFGLNSLGQVVGESNTTGDRAVHPFVWDRANGMIDLGVLGGKYGQALMSNGNGRVVGGSTLRGNVCCGAILWQQTDGKWRKTALGSTAGATFSFATAINSFGQVIGNLGYDQGPGAFLWEDGGPMVDLNTLVSPNSGLVIAEAGKINDAGEITANAHDASGNDHALLLIPCDENHLGVEGCDYSLVEASTTFVENALLVTISGSLTTAQKATPRGAQRPLRGHWAHR